MEENWIKVYEIDVYKINTYVWLEEVLKNDNIPYKNEIEEYWVGIKLPKYKNKLKIYVPQKYENIVRRYIEQYENKESILNENIQELEDDNDNENEKEVEKYNKIRKKLFKYYILFLIIIFIVIFTTIKISE